MSRVYRWDVVGDEDSSWTLVWEFGFVWIGPGNWAKGVVIDAACDFMARFLAGDIPDGFEDPRSPLELMRWRAATAHRCAA